MAVRLSALRAGRPLPPARFLVLISVRGLVLVDPKAGRIRSVKKSNDLIGNRTRNLPARNFNSIKGVLISTCVPRLQFKYVRYQPQLGNGLLLTLYIG
jgi:hypothetical protein